MARKTSFGNLIKNKKKVSSKFSKKNSDRRDNEKKFQYSYLTKRNPKLPPITQLEAFTNHRTLRKKKSFKKALSSSGHSIVKFHKHKSDLSPVTENDDDDDDEIQPKTKSHKVSESRNTSQETHATPINVFTFRNSRKKKSPPSFPSFSPPTFPTFSPKSKKDQYDDYDGQKPVHTKSKSSPPSSSSSNSSSSSSSMSM